MSNKVFITGGGGFLGLHIVKKLLQKDYRVTSFSRNKYESLSSLGVNCLTGDIKNSKDVIDASKGHDIIIHTASKVAMWGKWEDFYSTNVIGSENIIKAALEHKISKLIYTSSPSVVFGDSDLKHVDESMDYPQKFLSMYAHSKSIAEKKILEINGKNNIQTVALRPHLIFGPGDQNLVPKLIKSHQQKKLKRVGNGKNLVDVIYVENAADAHINAIHELDNNKLIAGKAFFLGQERPVNLWDFINDIMQRHGLPPVKAKISEKFAYHLGAMMEKTYKLFGIYNKDPLMTRFVALQLSKSHYFNHQRAKSELKYTPKISLEDALDQFPLPFH